ncbi:MAG: SBBP repeat-containing protein [Bacteroidota bacterium]
MKHGFLLALMYFASPSLLFSQVEHLSWASTIGGPAEDRSTAIAVDVEENVYSTGWFRSMVDFDPGEQSVSLISFGEEDIYVSKQGPSGEHLWTRSFGSSAQDYGRSLQLDSDGNVYVTGSFRGTVDFDPSVDVWNLSSAGDEDIFVLKLDPYGNFLWAQSMGGSRRDAGMSMEVGTSGNLYLAGYFSDSMQYSSATGSQTLLSNRFEDGFLLKMSSSGEVIWAHALGGAESNDWAQGLSLDGAENVYVTGYFGRTADFDPSPDSLVLIADAFTDIFICKFQADGQIEWARSLGGPALEFGLSIEADAVGNSYITGYFNSSLHCDSIHVLDPTLSLNSAGAWDIFLVKLDANGIFRWTKSMGGISGEQGVSLALTSRQELYLAGYYYGEPDMDPSSASVVLSSNGGADMYLSKLDTAGHLLWIESFGGPGDDAGNALAVDPLDNVYVAGHFSDTAAFEYAFAGTEFVSQGDKDIFLLKISTCTPPIASISQNSFTLTAEELEHTHYQWVDCNLGYIAIEGATERNFVAKENGSYACVLTTGACSDTSDCFVISTVGLDRFPELNATVYPNPSNGSFQLELGELHAALQLHLRDIRGRLIQHRDLRHVQHISLDIQAPSGIYFLHLKAEHKQTILKLIKE